MKTILLPFLALLLLVSMPSFAQSKGDKIEKKQPPGTVPINDTLNCDQSEITCFHWLEYLYWLTRIYGEGSPEHQAALPNTDDFRSYPCNKSLDEEYFRDPKFRDFPIQGISQEQAHLFSQWRSDRVFEYRLIEVKINTPHPGATPQDVFTIERYFSGYLRDSTEFYKDLVVYPAISYPKYSLPTATQRTQILDYVDSTDARYHQKHSGNWQKWLESSMPYQLEIKAYLDTTQQIPLRSADDGPKDKHGRNGLLYNIRGNVSEWGDAPGITYGGGWIHNLSYVLQNDAIPNQEPNGYTGFRNVCTWEKWTLK